MTKNTSDMTNCPIISGVWLYTIPIILTGILQLLFNAADLIVVGHLCGSVYVAAVGATGALINLLTNLFIGLSVGAGVTVAHGLGSGRFEDVRRTVHTAIPTAFVSGIILTVIGVAGARTFLEMMDTDAEVIVHSTRYMRIYFLGITASMLYNFGAAILRAAGDTRSPLVYLMIAGAANVVLNVVFIVALKMDVDGVASATAISQCLSAVLIIRELSRRTDACRFELKKVRFYPEQLRRIFRIGVPAGVQGSLFSISNVLIQSSVNSFGPTVMAGNAAAQNIEGFVYISMNSFHQTALNYTGQNFGARRFDRIRRISAVCIGSVFLTGLTLGLLAHSADRQLLSIYITDDAEAIRYGMIRVAYICIPYFLCGLMDVSTGLIRGLGSSLLPMLITVVGVCGIRIAWIYTVFRIPKYHTLQNLYFSYTISWALTFLTELIVFLIILKKRSRGAKEPIAQ